MSNEKCNNYDKLASKCPKLSHMLGKPISHIYGKFKLIRSKNAKIIHILVDLPYFLKLRRRRYVRSITRKR